MCDRDIRNFFKRDGSKSSTNRSNMIKQITLNPKKDMKKITKKPEKNTKKSKSKIVITKEEKEKEKKEFSTPAKKKVIEIKKSNIQLNKPNLNKSKKKKIIIDDEDESENNEIIKEIKEAGNIEDTPKNLKKEKKKEKQDYQILPPPVKKEEKLIPISVSDYFSSKKITLKTDKQIKEKKENKMEIEEEVKNENNDMDDDDDDKNDKKEVLEKKEEINKKNKENNKEKEKDEIDFDSYIFNDVIMETENKKKNNNDNKIGQIKEFNIKIDEKEKQKNINITLKEKDKDKDKEKKINETFKNEIKPKPIPVIKREIKKNIKNEEEKIPSKNINLDNNNKSKINESSNNDNKVPISELWTDKYAPKTIYDIIGNQQQLKNLEIWLDNWDNCILKGNKKEENKTGKKFYRNENVNARAAIISGPPGIGKTSSIRVLTKSKGYRTFELNASDKRNKDTINNSVGFLMNNTTLSSIDNSTMTKNVIIMDEVDGMAGNEDKGGIKALIDIVKKTKVPIIFICNDIYSPKLKALLNYCYDIRFYRPDRRQTVLRLMYICKKEGIFIDNQSLGYIVDSFGNDIRQTINYLDLCSRTKRNVNDIKKNCEEVKKDKSVTVSSFDICKILLNRNESSKLNFGQKLDLFFVDFDLIPNMIHENYIYTAIVNINGGPKKKESLEKIFEGLDHMSFGDSIENRMKSQMEWSLLPDKGIHSTVIPSMIFSSYLDFPKFPDYLNKISRIIKTDRQLKELKKIFNNYSLFEIKNLAGPLFYNLIVDKLVNEGKNGLDGIVDILAHYRMNANMFKENLYDLQSKENQAIFNKINTSIKTALTKKLNEKFKTSLKQHKTRTIMMPEIKFDKDGNLLEDVDYDDVDEEEADDQSSSIFEPIKKTNKKKEKKKKNK